MVQKSKDVWLGLKEIEMAKQAKADYEQARHQTARRLQDLAAESKRNRLFQIGMESLDIKVQKAEAALKGEQETLKLEQSRTKYLSANTEIQQRLWMADLNIKGFELSASGERLRSLQSVAETLSYRQPQALGSANHGV